MGDFGEEVTTIRVGGIPTHTTDTEFNCWFLFAPGFEQATLVPSPGRPQLGWARFASVEAALAAIQQLSSRQLTEHQSPENRTLHAEMAKSNFRPGGKGGGGKRQQQETDAQWYGPPAVQQVSRHQPARTGHATAPYPAPRSTRPRTGISTLFIGGLQEGCTEEELQQVLGEVSGGFERLKFVAPASGKPGFCLAKFFTEEYAEQACNALPNYAIASNPEAPLQAEFAKNDLDQGGAKGGGGKGPGPPALVGAAPPPPAVRAVAPPPQPQWPDRWSAGGQEASRPCDTMFIGNLAAGTSEQEVLGGLIGMPGFVRMKFNDSAKPIAFALFSSVEACSQAIDVLSGSAMPSAPQNTINVQFAKNSLDQRSNQY